jgi:hypothetical protein
MKTQLTIFLSVVALTFASANDSRYDETMAKNIEIVYNAKTHDELQQAVNQFERVGLAEKTKWEPFYYAAFGYVMMANQESDPSKKDAFLDQADAEIGKASAIRQDESEIVTMEGFISLIRITVNPAARGQQYTGLAGQSFRKALSLNPENPRALAMLAQMQFGTARFFNSSTEEACNTTRKALEKFSSYRSPNPLAPAWGNSMTRGLLEQCK